MRCRCFETFPGIRAPGDAVGVCVSQQVLTMGEEVAQSVRVHLSLSSSTHLLFCWTRTWDIGHYDFVWDCTDVFNDATIAEPDLTVRMTGDIRFVGDKYNCQTACVQFLQDSDD